MKKTIRTKPKLQAPWYTYRNKLAAMFARDPEIIVGEIVESRDERAEYLINVEVRSHRKYLALEKVLPRIVECGGLRVGIVLYDEENGHAGEDMSVLYETLFEGNPIVDEICAAEDWTCTRHVFVCFKPEVIQFFADDISDKNGNWSGLAQDIAREVFTADFGGVHFCTAANEEAEELSETDALN